LKQTELIVSIEVPFTTENQYVMSYMQSRRKEDDIALVSAAFFVELEAKEPNAKVVSARSIHGGMAAWTKQYV
jgi:xanthine dehydrogenase/oxidase